MDPNVDVGDEALKNILDQPMKLPKVFDSEVKHHLRTPAGRNYQLLMRALDRYVALDRMERNRTTQLLKQERGQAPATSATANIGRYMESATGVTLVRSRILPKQKEQRPKRHSPRQRLL